MDLGVLREDMVDGLRHESKDYLEDERVATALSTVPRHLFFEDDRLAYADQQTEQLGTRVFAPSMVARLFEALEIESGDSILIVGAGVGYTSAIAAEIAGQEHVHAIDITRDVVYEARKNLQRAGYSGVLVDCRDGKRSLPEYAPFDRILLEAAAVRPPRALLEQVGSDGRVVMGRGSGVQTLVAIEEGEVIDQFGRVSFRPMLVDGEQSGAIERNRMHREDTERAKQAAQSRAGWEREWIDWE